MSLILTPNSPRRERILLYGAEGTGKSYAYQRILASTPESVKFFVIDTDGGWEPAATSEEFKPHADRVVHYEPDSWPDYIEAMRETMKKMNRDRTDWMVVDLADQAWTEAQDWWHEKKYGDDFEAAIDDDSDPMDKWGTINKMYAPFAQALIRVPGNVLVCATEKELKKDNRGGYFRESAEDVRKYGPVGYRPGGQKKLAHDVNTVIRMTKKANGREMTVIKDRNRESRWGDETTRKVEDFALDFLVSIAQWVPAGKAEANGNQDA